MMTWDRLITFSRLKDDYETDAEVGRTPFHKDHDRIVFSGSFRRLDRKTQVHPLADNDHIHTRLTHSLEVGCIGRSLGMRVGEAIAEKLPMWVHPADLGACVQAACLAHDIGNPPFGHTGEDAIRHWFKDPDNEVHLDGLSDQQIADMKTFEGNALGFRILTQIEYNQFCGGMRLTATTLGAFLKYPWTSLSAGLGKEKGPKFSCFESEVAIMNAVGEKLGLLLQGEDQWCRHPLVYLVEAADDICYALLDLEDGIDMGNLTFDEVESLFLEIIQSETGDLLYESVGEMSRRRKIAALRGKAMDVLVDEVANAFVENEAAILRGDFEGDLISKCKAPAGSCLLRAKALARDRIFNDPRKTQLELGAYTTLGVLLDAFCGAAREMVNGGTMSYRHSRLMGLMGVNQPQPDWSIYDTYIRVLDFVGGMTDNYALKLAKQIGGLSR